SYVDGALAHAGPAARRRGTTVAVRRLFASLPARRKFMEHAGAEAARIAQVVRRYAVVHPGVTFSLVNETRPVLRTTGSSQVEVAVGESWGRHLQGALIALPPEERTGFRLTGWL